MFSKNQIFSFPYMDRMEKKGDRAAASETYERVMATRPNETSIAIEYGDFLGRVGKRDTLTQRKREEIYGKVLDAMPGNYIAAAMRALADIWISDNCNLDAARALISRAEAMEE
jgi:hypothetical protein